MAIWLVIKTLDVNYSPAKADSVEASFDGGGFAKLTATSRKGVHEILIPSSTKKIQIQVKRSRFWDVRQKFILDSSSTPPTLKFDGDQEINVRNVDVHSRGTDFNTEVYVVLGQLRDAFDEVDKVAANHSIDLIPQQKHSIMRFNTPIIDPTGTGIKLLRFTKKDVTPIPTANIFFAERTADPRLIAVFHPGWNVPHPPRQNPQKIPIPYHVFFHPFIPGTWSKDYPFSHDYIDLISRYLVIPYSRGKVMIHQNIADFPKIFFVFPVGGPGKRQMGNLNTQANMLRLLQEINYWVQRMRGASFPQQPLGRIAMSGFSAGARFLSAIFMGTKNKTFLDKLLKHVYVFDGVLGKGTTTFCRKLLSWHKGAQSDRTFRVYTQNINWWNLLKPANSDPKTTIVKGPGQAKEAEGPRHTVLLARESFWRLINPSAKYGGIHQYIPAKFMEHAVTNSKF